MTTLSVRDIAAQHLAKSGDLSVNGDVFGYIHRDDSGRLFGTLDDVAVLPFAGTAAIPTKRSLKRHLETVSGASVDVVLFLVGHEPDFTGVVSRAEATKMQYAVQVARDIWEQRDFGIRRLEWGTISPQQAGNLTDISTIFEALLLTIEFSGRPGAIDLFIVQTMGSLVGRSPKNGPCSKDSLVAMSGTVLELAEDPQFTGIGVAHELGHYLGLGHESDETNVMHGPTSIFGKCNTGPRMVNLTSAQATEMKEHCMVVQA